MCFRFFFTRVFDVFLCQLLWDWGDLFSSLNESLCKRGVWAVLWEIWLLDECSEELEISGLGSRLRLV